MNSPSLPQLAWRNLWRSPRRTVITLCALALGLLLAVMFTALQDRSFADMIDLAARMGSGHVVVQDEGYLDAPSLKRTVPHAEDLAGTVGALPGVARAIPRITGPVMLATAGRSYGAYFLAVDPALEDATSFAFGTALSSGEMIASADSKDIVLGARLAKNLHVGLGEKVVYTLMDKHGELASGVARLSGVVTTGAESTDRAIAILPRRAVAETLGYAPDEATLIAVTASDPRRADGVKADVSAVLGTGLRASTWNEVNPELQGFIAMKVGGARFMELVILILVAASIFNTLFVSVLERTREFGIMLAIGYAPRQIFSLVLWESLLLALVGVVAGCVITAPIYGYLAANPIDLSGVYAEQGQNMDIAGVGLSPTLKVGIFPESFAVIVVVLVLTTLAAGLYPAWRAGRTVPVDTIKLG